ncbi:MAG: CpsD/CapB family tyrosine-protein kinase [Clostridia bacterium]
MKSVSITRFPELDYGPNEALNTLCTNLTFMGSDVKKIMVTSCHAQEGKSFMTMNIMRTMASMGKAVVFVDADLRKSVIASRYGIKFPSDAQGLSHYLARDLVLDDVLYETDIVGAYMIHSGHDVLNSMQLLSGWRFPDLLNQLAKVFDYVLVDAPPVGLIIDAAMISRSCDGTLFVVSENTVSKRELWEAKRQIEKAGSPLLGCVLNKVAVDARSNKYYHRYYQRYYTHDEGGYYRRAAENKEHASSETGSKQ